MKMPQRNRFVQVTPYTTVIVTPELQAEMERQARKQLLWRLFLGLLLSGLLGGLGTAAALSFIFLYR